MFLGRGCRDRLVGVGLGFFFWVGGIVFWVERIICEYIRGVLVGSIGFRVELCLILVDLVGRLILWCKVCSIDYG